MSARAAPRRATMLIQAAANALGRAGLRMHGREQRRSPTRRRGRTTTYGKVADAAAQARAAEGRQAQGPEGLDDRRQAAEAARHGREARPASRSTASTSSCPGMLNAAITRLPGLRRQGEVLRRRQGARHAGRQEGRRGRRHRRRRRRRHLVAGEDRARRAADRLGRGRRTPSVEQRADRRGAEGGARREGGLRRQQGRRRQGGARRRGEDGRGGLQLPLPEPRHDGADERHGAVTPRQDARSGRRRRTARRRLPRRPRPPACRSPMSTCNKLHLGGGFGRRGASQDYVAPGRADRQADAGHAGQADLVARRGHDARLLPPDHAVQAARRARCRRQPGRRCTCASPGQSILAARAARQSCRTGATRSSSRASTRPGPKACSATRSRTC